MPKEKNYFGKKIFPGGWLTWYGFKSYYIVMGNGRFDKFMVKNYPYLAWCNFQLWVWDKTGYWIKFNAKQRDN